MRWPDAALLLFSMPDFPDSVCSEKLLSKANDVLQFAGIGWRWHEWPYYYRDSDVHMCGIVSSQINIRKFAIDDWWVVTADFLSHILAAGAQRHAPRKENDFGGKNT